MYQPFAVVLLCIAVTLIAGLALCTGAAYAFPMLWILWPLLFGGPMAIFGFGSGSAAPSLAGVLVWRILAVTFLLLPVIAAYLGRSRKIQYVTSEQ